MKILLAYSPAMTFASADAQLDFLFRIERLLSEGSFTATYKFALLIRLRGEAVYCFRQFRSLIGELVQSAWIRFIQRLPRNRPLLGHSQELGEFLFGADRSALGRFCSVLVDHQAGRCFYCDKPVGKVPAVDHFIPWSRYPMDLGHNLVLADVTCNSDKADRLAAVSHLARWTERNADDSLISRFEGAGLAHDRIVTGRVQEFAYRQAERTHAQVWVEGRDGLVVLDGSWRAASAMR